MIAINLHYLLYLTQSLNPTLLPKGLGQYVPVCHVTKLGQYVPVCHITKLGQYVPVCHITNFYRYSFRIHSLMKMEKTHFSETSFY
jgi:hypothetical protein